MSDDLIARLTDPGIQTQLLDAAGAANTAQLCIRYQGEMLLAQEYSTESVDVFAVQKGLLSLLIGIAEEKYLLEVLDNANHHLDPEWTRLSPWHEASLTIECLLSMTTGMDDDLGPLGVIGETWRYNNTAYNYLKQMLTQHTGLDLNTLSREWLLDPLAMKDTRWIDRDAKLPDGRPFTGLLSTAADLARLGQLVLNRGGLGERALVPRHYIASMTEPGSRENPAWGWCWWNNNQAHFKVPMREEVTHQGPILPLAPADLVAARGALDNFIHVVPSLDLVIARTARPGRGPGFEKQLWQILSGS